MVNDPEAETAPERELPDRPTEGVRPIVRRVLKADQVLAQAKLADVERVWRAALGPLGERSFVRGLRSGVLHVAVDSPACVCEIVGYYERAAMASLRDALPGRGVRRVKYVVVGAKVEDAKVWDAKVWDAKVADTE